MLVDAKGKIFIPAGVAREIGKVARVPVYGMLETYMGGGITGGFMIDHGALGRRAANIAVNSFS